jgi:hypothetical protein
VPIDYSIEFSFEAHWRTVSTKRVIELLGFKGVYRRNDAACP